MKRVIVVALMLALASPVFAKGSSGTGSKSSSTRTRSYTKKDGTRVQSYKRTTPDKTQKNNYSTKGNYNSSTGKTGKRSAKK